MKNTRLLLMLIAAGSLLLVPAVAMRFTSAVQWTLGDFLVAGVLLFGTVLVIELALRKVTGKVARIACCAAALIALLAIWSELAVGVFGSPFAGS